VGGWDGAGYGVAGWVTQDSTTMAGLRAEKYSDLPGSYLERCECADC
jgi:hypothetical protein